MSSVLRLSVILVLLLATAALGLIAYGAYQPKPPAPVVEIGPAPVTSGYLVAARPLPAGTLARDEDFAVRPAPSSQIPPGAILDTPDAKAGLRGSLVRRFVEAGAPVTSEDILRPHDRGPLASVLAPDMRAVSIKVDAESGVAGLISPGDYVDVILTQTSEKADLTHRSLSETVLRNVRVLAIDQDIVQGAKDNKDNGATAGRETHSVSLELSAAQVKKIAIAKELGKLSLAVRSAVEQRDQGDAGAMSGCDVSPEIAGQNAIASGSATVVVYAGDRAKEFSVPKHDAGAFGCDPARKIAERGAGLANLNSDAGKN